MSWLELSALSFEFVARPGAFHRLQNRSQARRAGAAKGDEIVVAGQFVHTGTPVVLWLDPAATTPIAWSGASVRLSNPPGKLQGRGRRPLQSNRYGVRHGPLTDPQIDRVRGGGWDLPLLQEVVDQFVIHFDACGTSRQCFKVLHDVRCLSVHFMLDLDGTIYQTLDLKERAWHATTSNTRSIGIEIANIGAYAVGRKNPFDEWVLGRFARTNPHHCPGPLWRKWSAPPVSLPGPCARSR